MIETPALEFVLAVEGQQKQKIVVDSDTARVGSGAYCEVRLAPEDAALEQLQLWARAEGIFAEARCLEPPTRLNGSAFLQGRLLPDSTLRIGRVELQVALVERYPVRAARSGSRRAGSRLLYALGGIGIPLGILIASPHAQPGGAAWDLRPQPLWAEEAPLECPSGDPGSSSALADMLRRQGVSARERAPFSPRDGVQAVELLSRAAACYAASGAPDLATRSLTDAATLKLELERQFHVHQVRLERALESHQYFQAKGEARILLSFATRHGNAYFDWLSTLDRQIDLQASRIKS